MKRFELTPWRWGGLGRLAQEERPLETLRHEMESLHREMDRLFDAVLLGDGGGLEMRMPGLWGRAETPVPRVDETEDDKAYHVAVELPGLEEKDIEVTLTDGALNIRGEKKAEKEEEGETFYRRERRYGAFRRTLPIPGEVDEAKVKAAFHNGVLKIDLPKTETAKSKIRHIEVKAA